MTTFLFFHHTAPQFTCSSYILTSTLLHLSFTYFSFIWRSLQYIHTTTHPENDNEWMNNKFATAVMMAEQQSNFTLTNYDCDRTLFSQHDNNCLQHHVYQDRSTYHNEVPTSSIGYIDNRVSANVSHFLPTLSTFFHCSQSSMSLPTSRFLFFLHLLSRPSWRMQIWRLCKNSRHSTRAQLSEGRVMAN